MKQLIIASGNTHKASEFAQLLSNSDFRVESAAVCGGMPKVDETGTTFVENARLKAEALRRVVPPDAWVLSDDSGLEVDALDGAPGVYSARYAGPDASDTDNVRKLLRAMSEVPRAKRTARFQCALCLISPKGKVATFIGSCEGRISHTPIGKNGFGYDPVFIPSAYDQSFAELGAKAKCRFSHRAKAVEALLATPDSGLDRLESGEGCGLG